MNSPLVTFFKNYKYYNVGKEIKYIKDQNKISKRLLSSSKKSFRAPNTIYKTGNNFQKLYYTVSDYFRKCKTI